MTYQRRKLAAFVATKSAGAPSEAQLASVNRYAIAPLTADQVYVRAAYLAHNAIDRDDEAFTDTLLDDFARTLPGKGLFVRHPGGWDGDSGPGVGRWFDARVVSMSFDEARAALRAPELQWPPGVQMARLLEASFYVPRTKAELIADIDAGVAGDVSIGFRAAQRAPIEGVNGEYAGALLFGPGEALEGSLVWLGAQPGARVTKAAKTNNREDNDVDELEKAQQQIKSLKAEKQAAETLADENAAKAKCFDALKGAVGDLVDKPAQLKAAVEDAKAYRDDLIGQAVKHRRLLGMTGDTPEEIEKVKGFYATMPLDMLKSDVEALAKKSPAGQAAQIEGGDPNATGAEDPAGGKGLRDASVTHKAVGLAAA